jgi:hypothetical protein
MKPPKNYLTPRVWLCWICGQPVVAGQRDADGYPQHYSCAKTTPGTEPGAEKENTHEHKSARRGRD